MSPIRKYRPVNLFVPALCRDALDRIGPLGNGLWLLAMLGYVGWVLLLLGFVVADMIQRREIFSVLASGDLFSTALGTVCVGAAAFAPTIFIRLAGGAIVLLLSGTFLVEYLALSIADMWSYASMRKPWPYGTAAIALFPLLTYLFASVFAQATLAATGLLLFGANKSWRAFSNGGSYDDDVKRLFYWLGVPDSGFYRGARARLLMLSAKMLHAIGSLAGFVALLALALLVFRQRPDPPAEAFYSLVYASAVVAVVVCVLAALACCALGQYFRHRFPPPRLGERTAVEDRPVFLRSFRDDSVALASARSMSPLPLPIDLPRSLDEIILARLPQTVAIGRPDETAAPFGVPRLYLASSQWQAEMAQILERSSLVLVCLDETPGVEWEITEILHRGNAYKAKFLMHPALPDDAKEKLIAAIGIDVPRRRLRSVRGIDCELSGVVRVYFGACNGATYRCMIGWMTER